MLLIDSVLTFSNSTFPYDFLLIVENFRTQGPVTEAKGEIVFYLDKKNKPKEKTIFSYHATTNVDKTKGSSSHGVKFSTPGLGKVRI